MKRLNIDLKNCYGIREMSLSIDYSDINTAVVYAPNGTMKSSLANTFRDIRDGVEVKERVYGRESKVCITDEYGTDILPDRIIVINPFENSSFDGQGMLMANEALRRQYIEIHESIDEKKKKLFSRFKENLGYSNRSGFDAKEKMLYELGYDKNKDIECLTALLSIIDDPCMEYPLIDASIKYDELFNDKVIEVIKEDDVATLLSEYEKQYNQIIDESPYMQKGIIDYNNYENISSVLESNGFFEAKNIIALKDKNGVGTVTINDKNELDGIIRREKDKVLKSETIKNTFNRINVILNKNVDTRAFAKLLQKYPELVVEYSHIDLFKMKVWLKVVKKNREAVEELLNDVNNAKEQLLRLNDEAREETTDWKKALELFKQRFYVPFNIETSNQEDVILKAEMPAFKYIFMDDQESIEVTKDNLLAVLSTGERRAYYILNMLFQIMVSEKQGGEYLLVLDDISESFDYKNKYAIIEYIKDITKMINTDGVKNFKVLLLTHNFDFYRTVASRITTRKNSYIAFTDTTRINFVNGHYTRNVFEHFKKNLNGNDKDKIIVASIPFVRNLIEYTEGKDNEDYLLLTSVLHSKDNTSDIALIQIQDIFNRYWCKSVQATFAVGRENEKIINMLFDEADKIEDVEKIDIENKLVLSMALRQKAEEYMKNRIAHHCSNGESILQGISETGNQTGSLVDAYKQHIDDENMGLMETVAMITPENIHLNSFMFEPILDMSLHYLYVTYRQVLTL